MSHGGLHEQTTRRLGEYEWRHSLFYKGFVFVWFEEEKKEGMGVGVHYWQLLQVSLWIDMSCCYLINFEIDSRLEELKRNAGVL